MTDRTNMPPKAKTVKIESKVYSVSKLIFSGSRGWEYVLSIPNGRGHVRVCHAPGHRVESAKTSGELIEYTW